jgi:hypothetical protein
MTHDKCNIGIFSLNEAFFKSFDSLEARVGVLTVCRASCKTSSNLES